MKNTINKLLAGLSASLFVLLLLGAAAATTKYVGTFVGHGGALTNASGATMNAFKASATNVAAGATIGEANGGALTNDSGWALSDFGTACLSNSAAFMNSQNATTNSNGSVSLQGSGIHFSLNATGNSANEKYYRWYVGADKLQLQRRTDNGETVLALPIIITNDAVVFNEGVVVVSTNAIAQWPPAPYLPGECALVNSNGFPYILLSTNGDGGGSETWTATNQLGW